MKWMRNWIAMLLLAAMLFGGCGQQASQEESKATEPADNTLWVLTEETDNFGMNGQARILISQFQEIYEGVTVKLDILPTDEAERAVYLESLRTQIMAGGGPDVYLLRVAQYLVYEPLFKDVSQSMHNGLFADISEYYDADDALGKEGLITAVMDAGVVGDARYVLPLRYDIPVAYVAREPFARTGLDAELFDSGMMAFQEALLALGDQSIAFSAGILWELPQFAMNFFPEVIDYENQELRLTEQEVAEFMRQYQSIKTLIGTDPGIFSPTFTSYAFQNFWAEQGYSMYIGRMRDAMLNAATAKALEIDLDMYPVAASDGSVIADVTYYGAVGAGCDDPALAYEFLRMFLSEDSQWEVNRQDTKNQEFAGMIADGWPVRSVGGTGNLWKIIRDQEREYKISDAQKGGQARQNKLLRMTLTDEELPILQAQIDKARFSIPAEVKLANILLVQLNDPNNNYAPTDADIDALAEELVRELEWSVAEG